MAVQRCPMSRNIPIGCPQTGGIGGTNPPPQCPQTGIVGPSYKDQDGCVRPCPKDPNAISAQIYIPQCHNQPIGNQPPSITTTFHLLEM